MRTGRFDFRKIFACILITLSFQYASAIVRYVKPVASGTGTGSSWANAASDLQLMINNSSTGDEIWVVQGTYYPIRLATTGVVSLNNRGNAFVLKAGVNIYGGFVGTEIFRSSRNFTSNVTTLSGDIGAAITKTDNCYHVVIGAGNISGNGLLDGFTVMNGYADAALGLTVNGQLIIANRGGGINITAASPTIQNCIVRRNEALNGTGGGGILSGSTSSPVINNCTISNNATTGPTSNGGGVYMASATATITNSNFTNNTSSSEGGAMYISTTSAPAITGCDFTGNTSVYQGGAISNYATAINSISNSNFINNTATDNTLGYGGGIYNDNSPCTVTASIFSDNTAQRGAGVYNKASVSSFTACSFNHNATPGVVGAVGGGMFNNQSSPVIINCEFRGNRGTYYGGAMFNQFSSSPKITNCLFSGNVALAGTGSGMSNQNNSSPIITNCTFSGNTGMSGNGATIHSNLSSLPVMRNCIVWGNENTYPASIDPATGLEITYCILQGSYVGTGNIVSDPLFINPQPVSAAPTTAGNYYIKKCSPAINTGNNTLIPAGITTDINNNPRISYATVDRGAYEKLLAVPDASGIVYVDSSNISNEGDGSSWANAVTQLADALKAAKTNTAIQQIWVAAGTYNPLYNSTDNGSLLSCPVSNRDNSFVLVNNVEVYGGFAGGESTTTGGNFITNATILSGDIGAQNNITDNCYHVIISAGVVGTAAVNGFTVTNGNANGSSFITFNGNLYRSEGGGIKTYQSAPRIINCNFIKNNATNSGGAHLEYSDAVATEPVFTNCIFSGNAAATDGGGIGLRNSIPIFTNCILSGNTASFGGGIYFENSYPKINNSTIASNYAGISGGGIYTNDIIPLAFIKNSIIYGNSAPASSNVNNYTWQVNNSIVEGGYPGVNNLNLNPFFLNPQIASVTPITSGDYRIHPCSPAVNTGNNSFVPAGITTDLDNNPRFVNTTVDLGAYEVQPGAAVSIIPSATTVVYVDNSKYGDGSSWASPAHNLADALKAAKTNTSIQQIWVKKGTYYPLYDAATLGCSPTDNRDKSFVMVNNVKIFGGFAGGETAPVGLNYITNETILSGDIGLANNITDNCYHVVVSAGAVGIADLGGFTITKGNANGAGNITVNGNISDRVRGAGITNLASSPNIFSCIISANTASGGAAIGNLNAAPRFSFCTFSSNTASNSGGVIDNYLNSAASINNCLFSGNTAAFGGAIMNSGGSSLTMNNSTFAANTATDGGAFYNQASSTASIINCVFKSNKASNGAAIYANNSSPQINNCTIAANLASVNGGGILNNNSSAAIINCIVWGNRAVTNNNIAVLSGSPLIKNSIIEGGFAGGTNIIDADPLFLSPQPASAAPSTIGDYHLQACSPAINYGDNSSVTALTDLDNNTRIKFIDVDLGAYEVQSQDLTQSTWRGINTNWNDRVNWCGGYIPLATTNITIPSGLTNYPTTALNNAVKNITLANNTAVTVSSTGSLSINGTYNNTGGTITNNGSWIMAGSSTSQSFPGATANIAAMNNLEINNPSGITFNKSFSITGSLIPTAGNINVNNVDITLKSSATATASIAIIKPAAAIMQTGTGSFIVERFINTGNNTALGQHAKTWQFLSTPVSGQTIFQSWQEGGTSPTGYGTIVTGTGTGFDLITVLPSIKFYNDNSNTWTAITNTSNALQNKLGYMLYVRGDRTVTTFTGTPNNTNMRSKGMIFTPINPPPSIPVQANKFESVGNPYASRIDFSRLRTASTGINDVFYVWDPKTPGNYQSGIYQTLTGITGYKPTAGGPLSYYPAGVASPYIESGQAIFIQGNGIGGNVNFNEDIKETDNRLVNRTDSADIANRQFLFASLFSDSGSIADGNIIAFEQGFDNAINDLDANKIMNAGENFSIQRNGKILAVEAHELLTSNDTIFYHLKNLQQKQYQLKFAPVNMQMVELPAFLIDRYTNSTTPISLSDSSFFDFVVTPDTSSASAERFMIVFKLRGTVPVSITTIKAYWHETNVNIEWHVENETNTGIYEIEKSLTGNGFIKIATVTARNASGSPGQDYVLQDANPQDENFYRIKSTGLDDEISYSNIVNIKRNKINNVISIYPNPVTGGNVQLWFTGMPAGTYTLRLFNASGQVVFTKKTKHDGFDQMIMIRLEKTLARGNYHAEINGPQNIRITIPLTN